MFASLTRFTLGLGLVCLAFSQAVGQDKKEAAPPKEGKDEKAGVIKKIEQEYRQFFKKPETALEYWAAMRFEIEVGKFDLASEFLKEFLRKNPTDEELLQIESEYGISEFLRLLTIPELRADAKPLVERVSEVIKKHRSDPERIKKWIKNLEESPEERSYAIAELRKSGAAAIPPLMDALLATPNPEEQSAIFSALPKLTRDAYPPLLACLDIDDPALKGQLIDLFRSKAEKSVVPYLWYLSVSPTEPEAIHKKALDTLAFFQGVAPDKLPPAKQACMELAERYYRHQIKFPFPDKVVVWKWENKQLNSQSLNATQAEEFYGLRWGRQALELDPAYRPAQVVFLSLAVEKALEQGGIDKPLDKGAPAVKDLLKVVNPDLVLNMLDRALNERRRAVILATVRTLGDLAEVRALQPLGSGSPPLVRALHYPDRRVELAAADAILRIPGSASALSSARVVEVLRRVVAADASPRVVIGDFNKDRGEATAAALKTAGFDAVVFQTGRALMNRLREAGDVDAVLIDYALPDPQLPYLLSQLRADADVGSLPVFVTFPATATAEAAPTEAMRKAQQALADAFLDNKQKVEFRTAKAAELIRHIQVNGVLVSPKTVQAIEELFDFGTEPALRTKANQVLTAMQPNSGLELRLQRLTERYRNVFVVPATNNPALLKNEITARIEASTGKALSAEERKDHAKLAMDWLRRIALGEMPGYDARPATEAIVKALRSEDLAAAAIKAAGNLPGRKPERELADVVLDKTRKPELRSAAAVELTRSIQQNGLVLNRSQVQGLQELYFSNEDPALKGNLALVLGTLRPDAAATGKRLTDYRPAPAAPPTPPKEK